MGAMGALMSDSNSSSFIYDKPPNWNDLLRQDALWDYDFGVQNNRRRYTQHVYRSAKDTRKKRKAHRAAVKLQRRLKKIRK